MSTRKNNSDQSMTFKELREAKGLRQVDIAYLVHVAPQTVLNWEKGKTVPRLSFSQILALATKFGVSPNELLASFSIGNLNMFLHENEEIDEK